MEYLATAVKHEFHTPRPAGAVPWPDQVDAEIATLKAQVRTLERIVHRLLNPAGEDPDCDRSGSY